jgi:teichuronic acid biosynthesis glycosyltransferase TuaH
MAKEAETYIVIAQQEWALNLGSNARNLAFTFSKTYPVMYVNPAVDIRSILKHILTAHGWKRLLLGLGIGKNTIQADANLWVHTPSSIAVSINWLKNISVYDWCNKRNAGSFFGSLKKAIRKLGWSNEKSIVFNDSQMFTGLYTKQMLQPLLSFYYIRDNLIEHPYFAFHGSRIEPLTIENADAVFANSAYLSNYAANHNPLSLDIGQGCELDMYDANKNYPAPVDIATIAHPRIGYIGFLTGERLDISLLEELALAKPDWHWVLIGPEETMFKESRLHSVPNVYFLGSRKPAELPGYLQQLDVCMNPQLVNPLTVGNYPRKIDEYLAMGKPTVATDTPAMHMFLPHVHLAIGATAYVTAIEKALSPRTDAEITEAVQFAKGHTWEACVEKIYAVQNRLLNNR